MCLILATVFLQDEADGIRGVLKNLAQDLSAHWNLSINQGL